MKTFNWGRSSITRLSGVNKVLQRFANRLLKRSKIDLTIPWRGGKRTAETQYAIFQSGASQRDGFNKKSYHQSGNALDVVAAGDTIAKMYDVEKLEYIMEVAEVIWCEMEEEGLTEGYVLELGGHWKNFYDPAHYQIVKK